MGALAKAVAEIEARARILAEDDERLADRECSTDFGSMNPAEVQMIRTSRRQRQRFGGLTEGQRMQRLETARLLSLYEREATIARTTIAQVGGYASSTHCLIRSNARLACRTIEYELRLRGEWPPEFDPLVDSR